MSTTSVETTISFHGLRLYDFRVVRKLCFTSSSVGGEEVNLVLETENREKNFQIELQFYQVTDFRIKDFGGGETRIIGFDIEDVSNRQWENINWKVLDFEHDAIAFLCKSVEVLSFLEIV